MRDIDIKVKTIDKVIERLELYITDQEKTKDIIKGLENKSEAIEKENLNLKMEMKKLSGKVKVIEDDYSNKLGEAEYKMEVMIALVKEITSQMHSKTSGMSEDKDGDKDGHNIIEPDSTHVNPLEVKKS